MDELKRIRQIAPVKPNNGVDVLIENSQSLPDVVHAVRASVIRLIKRRAIGGQPLFP
ncbi:MAG: hypothetical protein JO286_28165 [Solirubrobacterales bacterium]|nr:hypothetical protein [Solirubrobacterales bacterium]